MCPDENIDDFFKPKNLKSREEEQKRRIEELPTEIHEALKKFRKKNNREPQIILVGEEALYRIIDHLEKDGEVPTNIDGKLLFEDIRVIQAGILDLYEIF